MSEFEFQIGKFKYTIKPGEVFLIGRRREELREIDPALSRKHCELRVLTERECELKVLGRFAVVKSRDGTPRTGRLSQGDSAVVCASDFVKLVDREGGLEFQLNIKNPPIDNSRKRKRDSFSDFESLYNSPSLKRRKHSLLKTPMMKVGSSVESNSQKSQSEAPIVIDFNSPPDSASDKGLSQPELGTMDLDPTMEMEVGAKNPPPVIENKEEELSQENLESMNKFALGMCIIPTDLSKAKLAEIACKSIQQFFAAYKDPRLCIILVGPEDSASAFDSIVDDRFIFQVGQPSDVSKLNSIYAHDSQFRLNLTHWSFKPKGCKLNKRFHQMSDQLQKLSIQTHTTAKLWNKVYPVKIPKTEFLRKDERVHWVLQLSDPNARDSVAKEGSEAQREKKMFEIYRKVFKCFVDLVDISATDANILKSLDSSTNLMGHFSMLPVPNYEYPSCPRPANRGFWSDQLKRYIKKENREAILEPYIFFEDDEFTIMYDLYPKAKIHLLILPRSANVAHIGKLDPKNEDDVKLLQKMVARANWVVKAFTQRDLALNFEIGFHAIPSMGLLHLHVISLDLESNLLKNKKHYNSFTVGFLHAEQCLEMFQRKQRILVDLDYYKGIVKSSMKCFRCNQEVRTLPAMKSHLSKCRRPPKYLPKKIILDPIVRGEGPLDKFFKKKSKS